MVAVRREVLAVRHLSGEHGGDGLGGVGVGTRRVAEPRADRSQLGETWITIGVDRAVAAHDRGGGDLVEHDDDHRSTQGRHVYAPDVGGAVTGNELRGRAEEEERSDEQEVGDGKVGREQRAAAGLDDEQRQGRTDAKRERQHDNRAVDAEPSQDRERQGGRQQGDDGGVDRHPHRSAEERGSGHDGDPDQRGDERDDEREPHDLTSVVPPGDEELGIAPEEVEKRLGHSQAAQPQDHQRPAADCARHIHHPHRCEPKTEPAQASRRRPSPLKLRSVMERWFGASGSHASVT